MDIHYLITTFFKITHFYLKKDVDKGNPRSPFRTNFFFWDFPYIDEYEQNRNDI